MPTGNAIKTTLVKYKVRFEELLEESLGLIYIYIIFYVGFAFGLIHQSPQCWSIQGSNQWMTCPTWTTSRMNGPMRRHVLWIFCFPPSASGFHMISSIYIAGHIFIAVRCPPISAHIYIYIYIYYVYIYIYIYIGLLYSYNPAAGRRMPTCQGPGESHLGGNEENAIGLKCQCSGPSVPILDGVSAAFHL